MNILLINNLFIFTFQMFEEVIRKNSESSTTGRKYIKWGSEYQTSSPFKWSKRGWMPNGPVFKCHLNTGQPNHLNTGQMDTILFSVKLMLTHDDS